jgi:hypothetical protein
MLIQESLLLGAALMLYDNSLIRFFFNELPFSRDLFLKGLFCQKSQNVRKIFSHIFFMICY